MAKIMIAVPTYGRVSVDWAQNFNHIARPLGSFSFDVFDKSDRNIADKRNSLVKAAIDNGASHLFFLGDDVLPPSETFGIMLERMRQGYKAVTGVYWTKQQPVEPIIYKEYMEGAYFDWHVGEFFKLAMAGCDCLMLDVGMLKTIEPPWFSLEWKFAANQPHVQSAVETEDFYFYTKLKTAGVELWCDSRIQCMHQDRDSGICFGLNDPMPQNDSAKPIPKRVDKWVADIGSGLVWQPLYAEYTHVMRYDFDEKAKPDVRCDVRTIPEPPDKFDIVHASHVLEHFPHHECGYCLQEWIRILKPGGELIVKVPNLKCAFRSILEGPVEKYDWLMIYGQQTAKGEYHYNGFTLETLRNLAKNVGNLKDIKVEETNWDKFGVKSELTLTAKKIASSEPPSLAKVWGKEAEQSKPITEITEIPAEPTKKKLGRPKKQKQGESDVGKDS